MINNNCVISIVSGGIGNILFQVATAMTYAKRHNRVLYLFFSERGGINHERQKGYGEFLKHFTIINGLPENAILFTESRVPFEEVMLLPNFPKDIPIVFEGYWQNEKCFNNTLIKELFKPSEEIIQNIQEKYGDLSDYVSINVRRGDYVRLGMALNKDYYINTYNKYFSGRKAIIIGEDTEWNKANIPIEGAIYAEGNDVFVDLYLNYLCKDHILYNGTFGWWGAWLSETSDTKIVVPDSWASDLKLNRWIIEKD